VILNLAYYCCALETADQITFTAF